MLSYIQYQPSSLLARYIECYWIFKVPLMAASVVERLIPGGRVELMINLGHSMHFLANDKLEQGDLIDQVHVMGQRNRIYYAKSSGEMYMLGARFKPGGIHAFTRLPASELLNQVISAEDVLGGTLKGWKNRLREKKTDAEQIALLDLLMQQLVQYTTTEWNDCTKIIDIIRQDNVLSVNELCDENESYYKKLERSFLKYVGYTPKHYYRIVRFNKALRQMQFNQKSLTAISHDCDYYDQSHFIKDFRQFTGTTPRQFQSETHHIADFLISQQPV
ncbi:helix-turn-helix transcriptional regulator [Xanthocytophaga agilis]|uniref:Helix-turn-helix transcriptional regulator n=1 Tax=Xanthocytophaga agilis TaxID=3048010 RepID=A0AAE3R0Q6_9BACT|nr:helix-turn-helix transcriptional regulator [Xanthocytophaga agilis]MDJ1499497.1 helix-turn-helix transcriptional regulator [Xanthocytophaga agilis]